jgi:hypothetical protein
MELKVCSVCGFSETGAYCSRCGNELADSANSSRSALSTAWSYIANKSKGKIIDVIVVTKTGFLLAFAPAAFFEAYFTNSVPFSELPFPLAWLLRKLSHTPKGVTKPIQFLFVGVAVATFGGVLGRDTEGGPVPTTPVAKQLDHLFNQIDQHITGWQSLDSLIESAIEQLSSLMCISLFAFLFVRLLRKNSLPRDKNYTMWIYLWGLQLIILGLAAAMSPVIATIAFWIVGVYIFIMVPAEILPRIFRPITMKRVIFASVCAGLLVGAAFEIFDQALLMFFSAI